jgi:hypothetical protein
MGSRSTHREVKANMTDTIIKHKKEKKCVLLDEAIPEDMDVPQKEVEEKLKYMSLCIQIHERGK